MQYPLLKILFTNRIFQSILFGAFITVFVALVWNIPIHKYNLTISGEISDNSSREMVWMFDDFDHDGNSEKLRCYINSYTERLSVVFYNHNNKIIATPHFKKDFWTPLMEPAVADVNKDGRKDFLFFSLINDSIFFTALDVYSGEPVIDHLFFMQVERYTEKMGVTCKIYDEPDTKAISENELLFSFDAGYGLYPRGLFKLDLNTLQFVIPEKTYSPFELSGFKDLNNDGKSEILTRTYAPSNVDFSTKYPDTKTYITVYTSDLNYFIPPVSFNGKYSNIISYPDTDFNNLFYARIQSKSENGKASQVLTISSEGNIQKQIKLPSLAYEQNGSTFITIDEKPYLFVNNRGFFPLSPELESILDNIEQRLNESFIGRFQNFDLTGDKHDELISFSRDNKFVIYNLHNNHSSSIDLPIEIGIRYNIKPYWSNGKVKEFILISDASYFFFTYAKNPWYFSLYLIYLVLLMAFSGMIYLLLYFQQKRLEGKWQLEKQLSELQFNAVKNQLNPHFLFNSLNSVALFIVNGQKDEAYDFLAVNSRMIKRVLDDSKNVKRKLKEEIQFTRDYLKIQEHRFANRFTSSFIIHPDVNPDFEVPKMCIHTYVENAVKHGFRNTKKDGKLIVEISSLDNGVSIAIIDNGMGRNEAAKFTDSTGHGLKAMEEFYTLFEKYHGYKINSRIVDLKNQNDASTGTKVELKIEKAE